MFFYTACKLPIKTEEHYVVILKLVFIWILSGIQSAGLVMPKLK